MNLVIRKPLWVKNFIVFTPKRWYKFKVSLFTVVFAFSLFPRSQSLAIDIEQSGVFFWRTITQQFPSRENRIILIHLDKISLNIDGIKKRDRFPIDRSYLAKLIDKLGTAGVKNIGLDYVLDKATNSESDKVLSDSIRNLSKNQLTNFVFASITENEKQVSTFPDLNISSPKWSLQGNIKFPDYFPLLNDYPYIFDLWTSQSKSPPPFSYWLAMMSENPGYRGGSDELGESLIKSSKIDFTSIENEKSHHWFQSIIDYSIPPELVYELIPSEQLLKGLIEIDATKTKTVLIAPGGYKQAGIEEEGADIFHIPLAIRFRLIGGLRNSYEVDYFRENRNFTGGEIHAYMANQLLNKSLITRLPDWIFVLFVILFAILVVFIKPQPNRQSNGNSRLSSAMSLLILNLIYIVFCLNLYCSSGIFLPYLYPSISIWVVRLIITDKLFCLMTKKEINA